MASLCWSPCTKLGGCLFSASTSRTPLPLVPLPSFRPIPTAKGGMAILAYNACHAEDALARRLLASGLANLCSSIPSGSYVTQRDVRLAAFAAQEVPHALLRAMRSDAQDTRRDALRVWRRPDMWQGREAKTCLHARAMACLVWSYTRRVAWSIIVVSWC